jgi:hypothetical protein
MSEVVELASRRTANAAPARMTELTQMQIDAARIECRDLPAGWAGRVAMFCGESSRFIVGAKGRSYVNQPHVVMTAIGPAGYHVFLLDPRKPFPQHRVDLGKHLSLAAAFVLVRAALSTSSRATASTRGLTVKH